MKLPNPWHDARNQYSPAEFSVRAEPLREWEGITFYEVLSDHQVPSVLAVVEGKPVGQYVTVEGGIRDLKKKWNL